MKNKILYLILSVLMFGLTYKIIVVKIFPMRGMIADFSSPYFGIFSGILFFCVGVFFLFLAWKEKLYKPEYSKCPRCKKVFTYSILQRGKCPTCNIDTIDIEEYFKIYPDELEEKEEKEKA